MRLLPLLILAGCATPPQQVYYADGKPALAVECYQLQYCHSDMQRVCKGPYRPIDQQSLQDYMPNGSFYTHRITFRCQ